MHTAIDDVMDQPFEPNVIDLIASKQRSDKRRNDTGKAQSHSRFLFREFVNGAWTDKQYQNDGDCADTGKHAKDHADWYMPVSHPSESPIGKSSTTDTYHIHDAVAGRSIPWRNNLA